MGIDHLPEEIQSLHRACAFAYLYHRGHDLHKARAAVAPTYGVTPETIKADYERWKDVADQNAVKDITLLTDADVIFEGEHVPLIWTRGRFRTVPDPYAWFEDDFPLPLT
jgi:hypothetical protein